MVLEFSKAVSLLLALCLIQGFVARRWPAGATQGKVASGLLFGGICVIGMLVPVEVTPGVIFDSRSVVLGLAGVFGGPLTALIAAAMAGACRLWIGGQGAPVGAAFIVLVALMGVGFRALMARDGRPIGLWNLLLFSIVVQAASGLAFLLLPATLTAQTLGTAVPAMILGLAPLMAFLGLVMRALETQVETERALAESEAKFRDFAEVSSDWYWVLGPDLRFTAETSPWRGSGLQDEDVVGRLPWELPGITPGDETWASLRAELEAHRPLRDFELSYTETGGSRRHVRGNGKPVIGPDGTFRGYRGTSTDISRRRAIEETLRQAQKMEAVGQLTGGVAHDFNNLLGVIQGNAELLGRRTMPDPALVEAILAATTRGAELVQRLLAFSRRQPLCPKPVDLRGLVDEMSQMMDRTLGEGIEVDWSFEPDLWPATADAGQVSNALLNLALNARDAMPDGGRLSITCWNAVLDEAYLARHPDAVAGEHVALRVADTGEGMTAEVSARACDPFFSTKEVGRGSGLGLSMVYGFARQSGGHLAIASAAGEGTAVTLYLPRARSVPAHPAPAPLPGPGALPRGETILVVEDDRDMLRTTRISLADLGYSVETAADATAALEVLAQPGEVALVLTDLQLPGGTCGIALAGKIAASHPGLPVLFMSGNADGAATPDAIGAAHDRLLTKPFSAETLAEAVGAALRQRAPVGRSVDGMDARSTMS